MSAFPRVGNAVQALNAQRYRELDSRRQARTILHPEEVERGVSPARLLSTTLGGVLRPIGPVELAAFRKSVAELGDRVRGGITASEALGLSRAVDVDRAKAEIRYSLPVRLQAGKLHLVTDSGPKSKVSRHHVNVEFTGYSAALARPGSASQAAQWLVKSGTLRLECDCSHFRFTLRYVATAGGWVAGRAEHGFPKLKNPALDGACCKHLTRVMVDLQSSIGLRQRIAQMIEADRRRIDQPGKAKPKVITVSQREAEAMLPKRSRRIVLPQQRIGTKLPGPASLGDIHAAMSAYASKTDVQSRAIARALEALAAHRAGARQ